MSRTRSHLTWRAHRTTLSGKPELQTLMRCDFPAAKGETLCWVTIASGSEWEELIKIAQALNRARFTLFDIRPANRGGNRNGNELPKPARTRARNPKAARNRKSIKRGEK